MVEPLVNLKEKLSPTTPEHSFEPDKLNQRFAEIPPSTEVDQRCRFKAGFTLGDAPAFSASGAVSIGPRGWGPT